MTNPFSSAAPRSAAPSPAPASAAIAQAARLLLPDLERGRRIDAAILRAAMESAFGGGAHVLDLETRETIAWTDTNGWLARTLATSRAKRRGR